ncbi:MAG: glycerophosphodiester phosphodiesterase [Anaerorhabdus sp.]
MKKTRILTKLKARYIILFILFIYMLLQIVPYGKKDNVSPFLIKDGDLPLVIAHGGSKHIMPENTVMAFEYAYNLGVDALEMDLRLTSDEVLITYHNELLEDFSNLKGKPNQYTYDEIIKYNFAINFKDLQGNSPYANLTQDELESFDKALAPANLEDLFIKYGSSILYTCEIKDDGDVGNIAAKKLAELIKKYGLEKHVIVASFHKEPLKTFKELSPNTLTSYDTSSATEFIIYNYAGIGLFLANKNDGLQIPTKEYGIPLDTSYLLYKAHKNNLFVHYWTVNDADEMRKLIEKGADGIITDRPDILLDVLEEYK